LSFKGFVIHGNCHNCVVIIESVLWKTKTFAIVAQRDFCFNFLTIKSFGLFATIAYDSKDEKNQET
jgi:hypothetical protein